MRIVKIRGHGNDGARDVRVQARFCNAAKFTQHSGGHFLRRDRRTAHIESRKSARTLHELRGHVGGHGHAFGKAAAHETFGACNSCVGKLRGFILGLPTHNGFLAMQKSHHAWKQRAPLLIKQHAWTRFIADCNKRMSGAKINSNNGRHGQC